MKIIIISATNLTEGGPLKILLDTLHSAIEVLPSEYKIILFANNKNIIKHSKIKVLVFPSAKKYIIYRLYLEWYFYRKLSIRLKPDLWLSLHDLTPRVVVKHQVVYCHNASPFYKLHLNDVIHSPKFFIFNKLYLYLYKIFINRNSLIVVQQNNTRNLFYKYFGRLPILVSYPVENIFLSSKNDTSLNIKCKKFFYPTLPRVFKNIEVLCGAVLILIEKGFIDFELIITISGNENTYSKSLFRKYSNVNQIKFIGYQTAEQVKSIYDSSPVIIFPSKLESWGLPISEAKSRNLPLLVADLPYAHESIGSYNKVSFFDVCSSHQLAKLMIQIINGEWIPSIVNCDIPAAPFSSDWNHFWNFLSENFLLNNE